MLQSTDEHMWIVRVTHVGLDSNGLCVFTSQIDRVTCATPATVAPSIAEATLLLLRFPSSPFSVGQAMAAATDIREQVVALLEDKKAAPLTRWTAIVDLFKKHSLVYDMKIDPAAVLVHPKNRAKLGINAHNSHKLGSKIKKCGADFKMLANATVIEMAPPGTPARLEQLAFNESLITHAGGMLAPISGAERFLSVGCGHTAAFCKAAKAGCKTTWLDLAVDGKLSIDTITTSDEAFREMIEHGWTWLVVPFQLDQQFDGLADLAQSALNVSNSIAAPSSELEICMQIANFASMAECPDWDACMEAATVGAPPCKAWAHAMCRYVQRFGGGTGAPMVRFLDSFSKVFGANKMLGEEYFSAVVDVQLGTSPVEACPHLRTALLATNFVSPKVVDGVARLLTKTDVLNMGRKGQKQENLKGEAIFADAWNACTAKVDEKKMSVEEMHHVRGRSQTKVVLHMLSKGKHGPEQKVFANVEEIVAMFKAEMGDQKPATDRKPDEAKADSSHKSLSLSDLADPARICHEAGYKVGGLFAEKKSKILYKLISTGHQCTFESVTLGFKPVENTIVDIKDVCNNSRFTAYVGQPPAIIDESVCIERAMQRSAAFKLDTLRCTVFRSISAKLIQVGSTPLTYTLNASGVRAADRILKGKLELVSAVTLNLISGKQSTNSIEVSCGGTPLWLSEPPRPRNNSVITWKQESTIEPYWWVGRTDDESVGNMVLKKITDQDHVSYHIMVNSRIIKKHEVLMLLDAPPKASEPNGKRSRKA